MCIWVRVHASTDVHMHAEIGVSLQSVVIKNKGMRLCVCVNHMYVCVCVRECVCVCVNHMYVCLYERRHRKRVSECVCMFKSVRACMCVCVCVDLHVFEC